jgi:hypothetical protein
MDSTAFDFSSFEWRMAPHEKLGRLGILPNRIMYHQVTHAAALIVEQSTRYAE